MDVTDWITGTDGSESEPVATDGLGFDDEMDEFDDGMDEFDGEAGDDMGGFDDGMDEFDGDMGGFDDWRRRSKGGH